MRGLQASGLDVEVETRLTSSPSSGDSETDGSQSDEYTQEEINKMFEEHRRAEEAEYSKYNHEPSTHSFAARHPAVQALTTSTSRASEALPNDGSSSGSNAVTLATSSFLNSVASAFAKFSGTSSSASSNDAN